MHTSSIYTYPSTTWLWDASNSCNGSPPPPNLQSNKFLLHTSSYYYYHTPCNQIVVHQRPLIQLTSLRCNTSYIAKGRPETMSTTVLSDAPTSTIKRDNVMIYVHGIVDTSVVQHKHKRTLLVILSSHCINLNETTTQHRLEVVCNQYRWEVVLSIMFIKYSLLVEDCTPRKKVVDKSDYRLHYYRLVQESLCCY